MEYVFTVEAVICGYHEYKDVWDVPVGELLQCEREVGNVHDTLAVAIVKDGSGIVGHCPRKTSALCSIFIRCGSEITCQVTSGRQYLSDLPQGGLEVPCKLTFHMNQKFES